LRLNGNDGCAAENKKPPCNAPTTARREEDRDFHRGTRQVDDSVEIVISAVTIAGAGWKSIRAQDAVFLQSKSLYIKDLGVLASFGDFWRLSPIFALFCRVLPRFRAPQEGQLRGVFGAKKV